MDDKRIDTLQNNEMSQKKRNKEKLEKEAKIRCANFMIEMIKKYGAEIFFLVKVILLFKCSYIVVIMQV